MLRKVFIWLCAFAVLTCSANAQLFVTPSSGGIPASFFGLHFQWAWQGAGPAGFNNAKYPAPNAANSWVNTPYPSIPFGAYRIAQNALWFQLAPTTARTYTWAPLDVQLSFFYGKGVEVLYGDSAFTPAWSRTGTLTTTAGSGIGSTTLTFASVPSSADYTQPNAVVSPYGHGITITNLTHPTTIQAGTQGVHGSNTSTTITLTLPVVDGGVGGVQTGDVIQLLNVDKGQPPMRFQDAADWYTDLKNHVSTTFPGMKFEVEGPNEPVTQGNFFTGTIEELANYQAAFSQGLLAATPPGLRVGPGLNYAGGNTSPPTVRIADGLVYLLSTAGSGGVGISPVVDTYNFHGYTSSQNPETSYFDANASPQSFNIPNMKTVLAANGMGGKPLWNSEGGWGTFVGLSTNVCAFDYVAFVARYYLVQLIEGVQRVFWYSFDNFNWGQMWIPGTQYVGCVTVNNGGTGYAVGNLINPTAATTTYAAQYQVRLAPGGVVTSLNIVNPGSYTTTPPPATNGATSALSGTGTGLTVDTTMISVDANGNNQEGIAYGQLYKWLVGATNTGNTTGAVQWEVNLSRGSYSAKVIWNRNSSTTSYAVPAPYTQSRDLLGNITTGIQGTSISITGRPILLETNSVF